MWKKFNVLSYNIPTIYNTGFSIDSKKNYIVNAENNYKIKIPFNISTHNEIYYFELLSSSTMLTLTLIINIQLIYKLLNVGALIPYKNNLFKILKKSYHNRTNRVNGVDFKKFNNISNIINNKYTHLNCSEIIIIGELYFDLVSEQIYKKNHHNLSNSCNIFFLFGKHLNFNIANFKICIVDDGYKLIDRGVINRSNYKSINKKFFADNNLININTDFFFSNEYIKNYKKFHSNYKSKFAFENFKKYIDTQEDSYPTYNIELFSNFIIFIKDSHIAKCINHPAMYTQNNIFIVNSTLDIKKLSACKKILKKKCSVNNLNYNQVLTNHLYLDRYKYFLYAKYNSIETVDFCIYNIPNIQTNLNLFCKKIEEECPINRTVINRDTYATLNCKCNSYFCYNNLWIYFNTHQKCPYCSNTIEEIEVYINDKDLLLNLLGPNFNKYQSNKSNYIYMYNTPTNLNQFLLRCKQDLYSLDNLQIYGVGETSVEYINPDTILIIENTVKLVDVLNLFSNKEVRHISKIIKFSLSI